MKSYFLITVAASLLILTAPVLPAGATHPGGTVYAQVNGLVCDFCARALEKVFNKQEEVDNIKVDLDNKLITIHFAEGKTLTDTVIRELIRDSGYDVKDIQHEP